MYFLLLAVSVELQNLIRNTGKDLTIFLFLRRITLPSDCQATSLIKICTIYSMTDPFSAGKNCSSFRRQVFVVNFGDQSLKVFKCCARVLTLLSGHQQGDVPALNLQSLCDISNIYLRFLGLKTLIIRLVFFLGLVLGQ